MTDENTQEQEQEQPSQPQPPEVAPTITQAELISAALEVAQIIPRLRGVPPSVTDREKNEAFQRLEEAAAPFFPDEAA